MCKNPAWARVYWYLGIVSSHDVTSPTHVNLLWLPSTSSVNDMVITAQTTTNSNNVHHSVPNIALAWWLSHDALCCKYRKVSWIVSGTVIQIGRDLLMLIPTLVGWQKAPFKGSDYSTSAIIWQHLLHSCHIAWLLVLSYLHVTSSIMHVISFSMIWFEQFAKQDFIWQWNCHSTVLFGLWPKSCDYVSRPIYMCSKSCLLVLTDEGSPEFFWRWS